MKRGDFFYLWVYITRKNLLSCWTKGIVAFVRFLINVLFSHHFSSQLIINTDSCWYSVVLRRFTMFQWVIKIIKTIPILHDCNCGIFFKWINLNEIWPQMEIKASIWNLKLMFTKFSFTYYRLEVQFKYLLLSSSHAKWNCATRTNNRHQNANQLNLLTINLSWISFFPAEKKFYSPYLLGNRMKEKKKNSIKN